MGRNMKHNKDRNQDRMNMDNTFLQYTSAVEREDHAMAEMLEQDALKRAKAKKKISRAVGHVSLKQMLAVRR